MEEPRSRQQRWTHVDRQTYDRGLASYPRTTMGRSSSSIPKKRLVSSRSSLLASGGGSPLDSSEKQTTMRQSSTRRTESSSPRQAATHFHPSKNWQDLYDDNESFTIGDDTSTLASTPGPDYQLTAVIGMPQEDFVSPKEGLTASQKSSSSRRSVHERLYADAARRKQSVLSSSRRNDNKKTQPFPSSVRSWKSVPATPSANQNSVFERLYRNEKSSTRQQRHHETDDDSWSAARSLERRLGYTPVHYPPRSSQNPSVDEDHTDDSVFARLYRNESSSTTTADSRRRRHRRSRKDDPIMETWSPATSLARRLKYQAMNDPDAGAISVPPPALDEDSTLSSLYNNDDGSSSLGWSAAKRRQRAHQRAVAESDARKSALVKRLGYVPQVYQSISGISPNNHNSRSTPVASKQQQAVIERLYRGQRVKVRGADCVGAPSSTPRRTGGRQAQTDANNNNYFSDNDSWRPTVHEFWQTIPNARRTALVCRIQRAWRQYQCQRSSSTPDLLPLLNAEQKFQALLSIQRSWRQRQSQGDGRAQHADAISIQTTWRRYRAEYRFQITRLSIVLIQRQWRRRACWIQYKATRDDQRRVRTRVYNRSARTLQSWWRQAQMDRERQYSAIVIQTACVTFLNKKFRYHQAARIQMAWRSYSLRNRAAAIRSITVIQCLMRRRLARRKYLMMISRQYFQQRTASILIQNWWRKELSIGRKLLCVVRIQSIWRMCKAKHYFLHSRSQCRKIQVAWRRLYAQRWISAVTIQAYWRRAFLQSQYRAFLDRRNEVFAKHMFAIRLQSFWRMVLVRREFLLLERACIAVQAFCRHATRRKIYLSLRSNAIVIQSHCRRVTAMREVREVVALREQAAWHRAATRMQQVVRKALALNKLKALEEASNLKIYTGAISIQSIWRSRLAYKALDQMKRRKQCATKIQSMWKMWSARKHFLLLTSQCQVLQRWWLCVLHRNDFLCQRSSSKKIQAVWRMHAVVLNVTLEKARHRAIVRIQSLWRFFAVKQKFITMKSSVSRIESLWRCVQTRKKYVSQRSSVVKVQAIWRRFVAIQQLQMEKAELQLRVLCAIRIQCSWRMHSAFRQLESLQLGQMEMCAAKIQAWRRMSVFRQAFIKVRLANIRVTSFLVSVGARKNFLRMRSSAITLQSAWRRYAAIQEFKTVQTKQMELQRKFYYARKIQTQWRMFINRSYFLMQRAASVVVQCSWRTYAAIQERKDLHVAQLTAELYNVSATRIQSLWRMWSLRQDFLELAYQCQVIQAWWLSLATKEEFLRQRSSAVKIQSSWKRYQAHKKFTLQKAQILETRKRQVSATTIQALWKMWSMRQDFLLVAYQCQVVQAWWLCRRAQKTFLLQKSAAVKIQAVWRRPKSATVLQAGVRRFLCRIKVHRQKNAASLLQARFRQHRFLKVRHNAALRLQFVVRAFFARGLKNIRDAAAARVQAVWRGSRQRTLWTQEVAAMFKAIPVCQRAIRRFLAKKIREQKLLAAALVHRFVLLSSIKLLLLRLQCSTALARRSARGQIPACGVFALSQMNLALSSPLSDGFLAALGLGNLWWFAVKRAHDAAALILQNKVRAVQRRKCASVILQRYCRGYTLRNKFVRTVRLVVCMQAQMRRKLTRNLMRRRVAFARLIQSVYRGHSVRHRAVMARKEHVQSSMAAQKIQRWYERRHIERLGRAALYIQSRWRSFVVRKVTWEMKRRCCKATLVLQSWWRMVQVQRLLAVSKDALAEMATSENGWSDDEDLDLDDVESLSKLDDNVFVSSSLSSMPLPQDASPPPLPREDIMARYKAQLEASVNTWVANALVADNGKDDTTTTTASSSDPAHPSATWDTSLEAYLARARQARRQAGLY